MLLLHLFYLRQLDAQYEHLPPAPTVSYVTPAPVDKYSMPDTVWWMWVRISPSPTTVTIKSTESSCANSAHYAGDFVFSNLVSTSNWHVKLGGLKFNWAAVETEFVITVLHPRLLLGSAQGYLWHSLLHPIDMEPPVLQQFPVGEDHLRRVGVAPCTWRTPLLSCFQVCIWW